MARLPDGPPLDAPQGARPSMDTVSPSDLGLTAAGGALEAGAVASRRAEAMKIRTQAKADQEAVQPYLQQLQNANEDAFQVAAAKGDVGPGFAKQQIADAQDRAARIANLDGLTDGQKAELARAGQNETIRVGQNAIGHEAKMMAQPIIAQGVVQSNAALTGFLQAYTPAKQALIDGYDGKTPGLNTAVGAAFDTAAAAALAAAPPAQQPMLQEKLSAMKVDEVAGAMQVEHHAQATFVYGNAADQASAQINTIVSSPLAYDQVVKNGIPAIVATLPAALRKKATDDFMAQAAVARVTGLIQSQQSGQALSELGAGRYDHALDPATKEQLVAQAEAGARAHAPRNLDEAMAQQDIEAKAEAETTARTTTGQSTGQIDLDTLVKTFGPATAAAYASKWQAADRTYAAQGSARDATQGQLLARLGTPPPAATDPDYTTKIAAWTASQLAARQELQFRQNPGAWAWASNPTAGKAKPGQVAALADGGAMLQQGYQAFLQAQGPAKAQAGSRYTGQMLGVQEAAGVPKGAWQVVPPQEAAHLAGAVVNAPPEQKLAALQQLAATIDALPEVVHTQDGGVVNARDLLGRQLLAAHMTPVELSAVVDYGADPSKLGRVVAALNDTTLKKPLPGVEHRQLTQAVAQATAPFLASARPMPGAETLAQARIDRTTLVARELMASQGVGAIQAAQIAAKDMGDYAYVDGWRMPAPMAHAQSIAFGRSALWADGAQLTRTGAAKVLAGLTGNNGANLYAPSTLPGQVADRQRLFAQQVVKNAHWVTAPDDSGLMLMLPKPDGSWTQVPDAMGRPVTASWAQLQGQTQDGAKPLFGDPAHGGPPAPPGALPGPAGAPLPAVSKSAAAAALAWAVEGKETAGRPGQVSPKGAIGAMQIMPDTGAEMAPQLGLAWDPQRALNDPAYNRQIGAAILGRHVDHFGPGAGVGLALAAYNAGQGRLEGYRDPVTHQWIPGWLQTIGDPRKPGGPTLTQFVDRIPFPETRDYVRTVLGRAVAHLAGR